MSTHNSRRKRAGTRLFCVMSYHMIVTQVAWSNNIFSAINTQFICLISISKNYCSLTIPLYLNCTLFTNYDNTLRATSHISQICSTARFLAVISKLCSTCVHRYRLLLNNSLSLSFNKRIYRRWCVTFNFSLGWYSWRFLPVEQEDGTVFFSHSFLKGVWHNFPHTLR